MGWRPAGTHRHATGLLETAGQRLVGREAAGRERGEAQDMTKSTIGDSPKRREDARFITGGGAYLDDLPFDRLAHAVVLRSPHAHAWIHAVKVDAARAAPGVLAVLTAADAAPARPRPRPPHARGTVPTGEPAPLPAPPRLA